MKNTKKFGAFAAVAAAMMCAHNAWAVAWTGIHELHEDFSNNVDVAAGASEQRGSVVQNDGNVYFRGDCVFGRYTYSDTAAAYLLNGGTFTMNNGFLCWGSYFQFRTTGGLIPWTRFRRATDRFAPDTICSDIVFGGDCVSSNTISSLAGSYCLAIMDNAFVSDTYSGGNGCDGMWISGRDTPGASRIICLNGGYLVGNSTAGSINFYAFNGGTLETRYGTNSAFGYGDDRNSGQPMPSTLPTTNAILHSIVRVYEKGGCFINGSDAWSESMRIVRPPAFREPEGNVVWSIPIPADHALRDMTFEVPPSVIIEDSTGSGTNATAIADWDYVSGKVTNITVLCRGIKYSGGEGDVTANLRFRDGIENYLLAEPLVCEVGPCTSGGFTFGGGKTIYFEGYITNNYHGTTIVDMDMYGRYETTNAAGEKTVKPYGGGDMSVLSVGRFYNTDRIIVKSGLFYSGSSASANIIFPDARHLELYGGYMGRFYTSSFETITVGGRTELSSRGEDTPTYLVVTDTLYVDPSCINEKGITPSLTKGRDAWLGDLTFGSGAKLELKNWESLPKGKRVAVLDLSGLAAVAGTPTLVQSPDEGVLYWDSTEHQLYARRHSDGMMLIFK